MEKMTFSQKVENFWYHHKYTVIIVTVSLIFLAVCLVQTFSKKSPDANFLYMGTASISFTSQGEIQESAAKFMKEDYNGDGKKSIDYIELTVLDPDKAQNFSETTYTSHEIDNASGQRFIAELVAGDSMIYFTSETYYNMALEQKILMPLSEILGYTPENANDEYSIYLKDLDIFYLPGFCKLPADTLIFVRYPVSVTESKNKLEEREKNNLAVFRDMIEYVYPDKPEEEEKTVIRTTSDDFLSLYSAWCEKNSYELTDTPVFTELSTDEFFNETSATVFKCNYRTFVAYDGVLYSLGRQNSDYGVLDIDTCDFDNNGITDIVFTYAYTDTSYNCCAAVFNLSTLRESQPIRVPGEIKSGEFLILEKIDNTKINILKTSASQENLKESLTSLSEGSICASIISSEGNIAIEYVK